MADSPEDYELFHYGVKGMKWGVRKNPIKAVIGRQRDITNARKRVVELNREISRSSKNGKSGSEDHKKLLSERKAARELSAKDTPVEFAVKAAVKAYGMKVSYDILSGNGHKFIAPTYSSPQTNRGRKYTQRATRKASAFSDSRGLPASPTSQDWRDFVN